MALLRGKLFAGVLFAGVLLGHQQVGDQPVAVAPVEVAHYPGPTPHILKLRKRNKELELLAEVKKPITADTTVSQIHAEDEIMLTVIMNSVLQELI